MNININDYQYNILPKMKKKALRKNFEFEFS